MNALDQMLEAALTGGPAPATACGCDAAGIHDVPTLQKVPVGDDGQILEVEVPVVTCQACGVRHTDERAERLIHAAICRHQGLLTPEEVKAVRISLAMSRKEFSEAYGIPPASMERWENGRLLQNKSMDTLLRALGNRAMASRIDRRSEERADVVVGSVIHAAFGELAAKPLAEQKEILERQRRFSPRRAA